MNELNLRRICAKIEIGAQKPNFFNNPQLLPNLINCSARQAKFKIRCFPNENILKVVILLFLALCK
jgi:hypothetical protein